MKQDRSDYLIRQVYATFGRGIPSGDVKSVIWDRVREIPDEATQFIADKICNRDDLPRNMSKAILDAWAEWRAANPSRIVREHCPHCLDVGAFHCWAKEPKSGKWHKYAVPCPYCQTPADGSRVPADLRAMREAGVDIMPPDFNGGPVEYDRNKGYGCLWPVDMDTSTPREKMKVGVDMRQDSRRVQHLPAAERRDNLPEVW